MKRQFVDKMKCIHLQQKPISPYLLSEKEHLNWTLLAEISRLYTADNVYILKIPPFLALLPSPHRFKFLLKLQFPPILDAFNYSLISKISFFLICKKFATSLQKQQKCNIYRLSRVAGIVLSRYIYFCLESTVSEQVTVQFIYIICLTAWILCIRSRIAR